jgi:hypothetical protein
MVTMAGYICECLYWTILSVEKSITVCWNLIQGALKGKDQGDTAKEGRGSMLEISVNAQLIKPYA